MLLLPKVIYLSNQTDLSKLDIRDISYKKNPQPLIKIKYKRLYDIYKHYKESQIDLLSNQLH